MNASPAFENLAREKSRAEPDDFSGNCGV